MLYNIQWTTDPLTGVGGIASQNQNPTNTALSRKRCQATFITATDAFLAETNSETTVSKNVMASQEVKHCVAGIELLNLQLTDCSQLSTNFGLHPH